MVEDESDGEVASVSTNTGKVERWTRTINDVVDEIRTVLYKSSLDPPTVIVTTPEFYTDWVRVGLKWDSQHFNLRSFRDAPLEVRQPNEYIYERWGKDGRPEGRPVVAQIIWMDGPWVRKIHNVVLERSTDDTEEEG